MIYLHVRSISSVPIVWYRKEKHDYGKRICKKKGKKWYYRFYVEDQSGNLVQKEYDGTENKSETEKLLRQAMEDYESKKLKWQVMTKKDFLLFPLRLSHKGKNKGKI